MLKAYDKKHKRERANLGGTLQELSKYVQGNLEVQKPAFFGPAVSFNSNVRDSSSRSTSRILE